MKIQVMSDLHLEFGDYNAKTAIGIDVLVLAGDIHTNHKGVKWVVERFKHVKHVIYVPGNHEYYGQNIGSVIRKCHEAAEGSNVHVLDNDYIVIDGVRFIGATLWTDFNLTSNQPLAMWDAGQTMTDYKRIRDENYHKLTPAKTAKLHRDSKEFIMDELERDWITPTVIVSHHAPSDMSIHERFKTHDNHLNAAYASRLEYMFGGNLVLWCHGHVHDSFDYEFHGTRVVCNPRGYVGVELNEDFEEMKVITV